jgi:hypothetical protein
LPRWAYYLVIKKQKKPFLAFCMSNKLHFLIFHSGYSVTDFWLSS